MIAGECMFQSNLLWRIINCAAVISMFMVSLTSCNTAKTTSPLRVTEPTVYETKTKVSLELVKSCTATAQR